MQCCDRFLYYYILTVISPHQPFQNRTIPQKSPTLLAPLPKVSFCCSAKHCQLLRVLHTNTAGNTFRIDKKLIFSWHYQCNCSNIDSSKKTPLTWDICTNLRTCSVKRPCINRIYNVQVVLRVTPTPQRGTGVGKERGSHEGENLRDRVRGGSPAEL